MQVSSQTGSFVRNNIIANASRRDVWGIVLMLAGVILITVSAKIQVPFWPVPMTLQTLAIMVVVASFGLRLGLATVLAYLSAGFVGLPVFAGPIAGPAYFMGPTAGFLAGFVIAALIVGYAADKGWSKSPIKLFASMAIADIVIFALGFVWLGFMFVSAKSGMTLGAETAFKVGVQPYILADIVKIAIAACIVPAMWSVTKRFRN